MNNKSMIFCLFFTILTQVTVSIPILTRVKHQAETLVLVAIRHPEGDVDFNNNGEKLYIYAILKFGSSPAINATVIATLTPAKNAGFTVALFDNGKGIDNDPNDGTYSGVIENCQTPGRHSIIYTAEAVHPDCNPAPQTNCELFRRSYNGGSVNIKNCAIGGQLSGHGVLDLEVLNSDKSDSIITIKWTEGWKDTTIVAYDLVYIKSTTTGNVVQEWVDHGKVLVNLMPAQPIQTERTSRVDLSHLNGEIKIAIVARSLTGDMEKSNIRSVYINDVTESTVEHIDVTTTITTGKDIITEGTTDESLSTLSTSQVDEITIDSTFEAATPFNDTNKSGSEAWIFIGIGIGCLFVISGIVALIIFRKNRKNANC